MSTKRHARILQLAVVAAALSLAACKRQPSEAELAKLDNQIIANDADPALTSALEDQIMVDPALTQQSNRNSARAPTAPGQAQHPLPGGGNQPKAAGAAKAQAAAATGAARTASAADDDISGVADCGPQLNYNAVWARRLPAAFTVYPGARITDAAGSDAKDCASRVVTFTTAAPPQRVLEYYGARARGAGYSAEHQRREGDHILAGASAGGAFYLILTPLRGGGSDVAMITKGG